MEADLPSHPGHNRCQEHHSHGQQNRPQAEGESEGIAKVIFRKDTYEVLGVHIVGLHAADLIQECSNAINAGSTLEDLAMMVHTHPTLCEVLDEAFKAGLGRAAH